jgi:hypothetical protein
MPKEATSLLTSAATARDASGSGRVASTRACARVRVIFSTKLIEATHPGARDCSLSLAIWRARVRALLRSSTSLRTRARTTRALVSRPSRRRIMTPLSGLMAPPGQAQTVSWEKPRRPARVLARSRISLSRTKTFGHALQSSDGGAPASAMAGRGTLCCLCHRWQRPAI